jgi:CDP-glucose 4,6-dehydratase
MEMKSELGIAYKGKRVLVTGHTGFKGSWLTIWLLELGADVIGYSLKPVTRPSIFVQAGLSKKITSVIADVRDLKKLKETVNRYNPQIIFHLAAQSLVRESYRNPHETFEINCLGTANVCEAMKQNKKIKGLVAVTTDKVYANTGKSSGYRENDPLGGFDPYSSSKAAAELVCASYRDSYGLAIATCRAGNSIGAGDWAKDRIIPDCIRALTQGKPIEIRYPESIRPWQHVLESLHGYLILGEKLLEEKKEFARSWNFGPDVKNALTVRELTRAVIACWGSGKYRVKRNDSLHESTTLLLDSSGARKMLGWKARFTCQEAIELTVKGYRDLLRKKNCYSACLDNIYKFCERKIDD